MFRLPQLERHQHIRCRLDLGPLPGELLTYACQWYNEIDACASKH